MGVKACEDPRTFNLDPGLCEVKVRSQKAVSKSQVQHGRLKFEVRHRTPCNAWFALDCKALRCTSLYCAKDALHGSQRSRQLRDGVALENGRTKRPYKVCTQRCYQQVPGIHTSLRGTRLGL